MALGHPADVECPQTVAVAVAVAVAAAAAVLLLHVSELLEDYPVDKEYFNDPRLTQPYFSSTNQYRSSYHYVPRLSNLVMSNQYQNTEQAS